MTSTDYLIMVQPLSAEDGGGYLASAPELPGCASDGETPEAAMRNLGDAIAAWIEEAQATGRPVPRPGSVVIRMEPAAAK